MSRYLAKFLVSRLMRSIGKAIFLSLIRELAKKSDNTIDDAIVKAVEEAINGQ